MNLSSLSLLVEWSQQLAIQLLVGSTVVLLAATVACALARNASAAVRHRIWSLSALGLLVLPVVAPLLPQVNVELWTNLAETEIRPATEGQTSRSELAIGSTTGEITVGDFFAHEQSVGPESVSSASGPMIDRTATSLSPAGIAWRALGLAWLIGACFGLLTMIKSTHGASALVRRAAMVNRPDVLSLRDAVARQAGVRTPIDVLCSAETLVPLTTGLFRSSIILPAGYGNWGVPRLRVALAHEMFHVSRRDVLWQALAQFARAQYWIQPLVWLAVWRMRVEREHACDDAVLQIGERPTDYAARLVEFAALFTKRSSAMRAAVEMAACSEVEERVRAILKPDIARGPVSRPLGTMLVIATAAAVLLGGSLRPPEAQGRQSDDQANSNEQEGSKPAEQLKESPKVRLNTAEEKEPEPIPAGFREMVVRTVDDGGKPVPQARIHVSIWPKGEFKTSRRDYETDANGEAVVLVPDPPRLFRIWTQMDGYVPLFAQWWPEQQPDGHRIPQEFTFKLPSGKRSAGSFKTMRASRSWAQR